MASAPAELAPRPRIHRREPILRGSFIASVVAHVMLIFVLPLSLRYFGGCHGVDQYFIPGGGGGGGGGGGPKVEMVKVMRAKSPERRRKRLSRPNSAISLYFPSIDESEVATDVEAETLNTYVAQTDKIDEMTAGGTGLGFGTGPGDGSIGSGGGKGGGFAGGSRNGVVRFIRLQHDAPGWDDGMNADHRADVNFLEEFHRVSKFKVADKGEAIPIVALRQFKAGAVPPFLYMTGNGPIAGVTPGEVKTLREYMLGGGMLFADAGGDQWDRSFRDLMRQAFPDKGLTDVANDDPIFQYPFRFPNGAPRLWQHGGSRAMGIKHEGRWVVFYHPGDMNDAWKTGHSGARPEVATQSMRLGMNVVVYSFANYRPLRGNDE